MTHIKELYDAADLLFDEQGVRRAEDDVTRKRALKVLESIKQNIPQNPPRAGQNRNEG